MNPKIKELLHTIGSSEEEQCVFLSAYFTKKYHITEDWPYWYGICNILLHGETCERATVLAKLAFQLRNSCHDPLTSCAWDRASWEVWDYVHMLAGNRISERKHLTVEIKEEYCLTWTMFWAEPIDWIIIALIALEIVADPEEKFDAHRIQRDEEEREMMYAIGQDDGGGSFGMWDGPNPSLEEMLSVEGRDENSVILRFNKDGSDEIFCRWLNYGWCKI